MSDVDLYCTCPHCVSGRREWLLSDAMVEEFADALAHYDNWDDDSRDQWPHAWRNAKILYRTRARRLLEAIVAAQEKNQ